MRTMLKGFVKVSVVVALVVLGSGYLYAQPYPGMLQDVYPIGMKLSLSLTATVQGADDYGDPIDKIATSTAKINNATLIGLINAAEGSSYPTTSTLIFVVGSVYLLESATSEPVDLSSYFQIQYDMMGDSGVWSGQVNNTTGALKYTGSWGIAVAFDDGNGNTINFGAVVKETMNAGAPTRAGKVNISDSLSGTGYGNGTWGVDSAPTYFSGTVNLTGKAVVDAGTGVKIPKRTKK